VPRNPVIWCKTAALIWIAFRDQDAAERENERYAAHVCTSGHEAKFQTGRWPAWVEQEFEVAGLDIVDSGYRRKDIYEKWPKSGGRKGDRQSRAGKPLQHNEDYAVAHEIAMYILGLRPPHDDGTAKTRRRQLAPEYATPCEGVLSLAELAHRFGYSSEFSGAFRRIWWGRPNIKTGHTTSTDDPWATDAISLPLAIAENYILVREQFVPLFDTGDLVPEPEVDVALLRDRLAAWTKGVRRGRKPGEKNRHG